MSSGEDVTIAILCPILHVPLQAQLLSITLLIARAIPQSILITVLYTILCGIQRPIAARDPILDPVLVGDSVPITILNAILIRRPILVSRGIAHSVPISVLCVYGDRCESSDRDHGRQSRHSSFRRHRGLRFSNISI
jgi:hypothetical protein